MIRLIQPNPAPTAHQRTPLASLELALEKMMVRLGEEQYAKRAWEAREKAQGTRFGALQALLGRIVGPVAEELQAINYRYRTANKTKGRKPAVVSMMKEVSPEVAAYLTVQVIMDQCSAVDRHNPGGSRFRGGGGAAGAVGLTALAGKVTAVIMNEARFSCFKQSEPHLYRYLQKKFKKANTTSIGHKSKVLNHHMALAGIEYSGLDATATARLGAQLIDIVARRTGLIEQIKEVRVGRNAKHPTWVVRFTDETLKAVQDLDQTMIKPVWMPMVERPKPWYSIHEGGYQYLQLPLVKLPTMEDQKSLSEKSIPVVLEAANAMQNTRWRVNQLVLTVARTLWEQEEPADVLGNKALLPIPPRYPEDQVALDPDGFRAHKAVIFATRMENKTRATKALSTGKALRLAVDLEDEAAFYFPHTLDWRGRAYPVPRGLEPQGSDLEKGLLEFADAVPLGEHGAEWLAVHGANVWGYDKVSLEERIEWVGENAWEIRDTVKDPFTSTAWHQADKPWQFLAFCMEWVAMLDHPGPIAEFKSRLPVHLDGSCNGLQHFAALMRDEVGGKAVNLVPQAEPADVYSEVLDVLVGKVGASLRWTTADPKTVAFATTAKRWLDSGLLTRKLVKRPVMTLPYGSSKYGTANQMYLDVVHDALQESPDLLGPEPMEAINWLNRLLWESLEEVVVGARAVMEWLQAVAEIAVQHDLPLAWVAPSGLPITQTYFKSRAHKVRTEVAGPRYLKVHTGDRTKLVKSKMKTAIAPNFIHSMDAAHLSFTLAECHRRGVRSFAMVHDSYGTHAGNAGTMARVLREEFVRMYIEHAPLESLRDSVQAQLPSGVELPTLPPRGNLEIREVLESDYFFA